MGENVNHQKVKNSGNTNKKTAKRNFPAVSKFLTKKAAKSIQKEEGNADSSAQPSNASKVTIKRVCRNYIALNDRFPSKTVLIYLLEDQLFNLNLVHNMKNLYLFEKLL